MKEAPALRDFLSQVPFFAKGTRRFVDDRIEVTSIGLDTDRAISTQTAFGKILDGISKEEGAFADRIVTTSPDVTGTTSVGPWVNRRKLFARDAQVDTIFENKIPWTAKWEFTTDGQHIELGI